jgi:hypothetical protein
MKIRHASEDKHKRMETSTIERRQARKSEDKHKRMKTSHARVKTSTRSVFVVRMKTSTRE